MVLDNLPDLHTCGQAWRNRLGNGSQSGGACNSFESRAAASTDLVLDVYTHGEGGGQGR